MDFSNMSDEELMKIAGMAKDPSDPAPQVDYSQMSDDDLRKVAGVADMKIVDEAHPAVSWKDRALVKNFGTGSGVGYLRTKYPNLQIEERDGEVLMKGKNENQWRKLDPSTIELADVGDIAYDVGAGLLEGAATVAGAAGGVPGALAAGAASGVGMEALRQKIGEALGVNKEMDKSQLAAAGAAGAISPLLFGTGKAGSKVLEKGIIGSGYEKLTRGLAPEIAGITSGEKAKVFRDYVGNPKTMKFLSDENNLKKYVDEAGRTLETSLKNRKRDVGKKIGDVLSELPDTDVSEVINLSQLRGGLEQEFDMLMKSLDPDDRVIGKSLMNKLKRGFGRYVETPSGDLKFSGKFKDKMSYDDAMALRNKFRKEAKFGTNINELPTNQQYVAEKAREIYMGLNDAIDASIDALDPKYAGRLKDLRMDYKQAVELEDEVIKLAKGRGGSYKKMFDTMRTLDNNSKEYVRAQIKDVDPKVLKKADMIEAHSRLAKASYFPTSGPSTSTTKTLAMAGLGGVIGEQQGNPLLGIGVGLVGMSPRAWRTYLKMGKAGEDAIKNAFKRAGQKAPKDLQKYFNRQMAAQGTWNAIREREGQE